MLSLASVVRSSANFQRNNAPNPTISSIGARMFKRMGVIISRRPVRAGARAAAEYPWPARRGSASRGHDETIDPPKSGVHVSESLLPLPPQRWHAGRSGGLIMARSSPLSAHHQHLERRVLLSFTTTAPDGTVFLHGTSGDDQITISFQHTGVALTLNGETELFDQVPPRIHVLAGDGNDTIDAHVAPGGVDIEGDAGNDDIHGSVFADTIYGWDGDDTIIGDGGRDLIRGGAGDDSLIGDGGGNDLLVASDTIFGDDGLDFIDAGPGSDVARGGAGDDTVQGGSGNDRIMGDDGNDTLDGGAGADRLYGGAGDDKFLTQDRARDTIDGGSGSNDT